MFALLFLAAAIAAPVAETPASKAANFTIGGVDLELPLPAGYCIPAGKEAAIAQLLATGDTESVTDLSLIPCGKEMGEGANDYTLIKTPNKALLATADRANFLKELGAEFEKPEFAAAMASEDAMKKPSDDVSKAIGTRIDLKSAIKPLGRDDTCGYIGGIVDVKVADTTYQQAVGGCITTVSGKIVIVFRYGTHTDSPAILGLIREARGVALAIRPRTKS